jgi:uncharacterized membrane protein YbhN (UPF0104 family)
MPTPPTDLQTAHVERTVRSRLVKIVLLAAIAVSLLLAVPGLRSVASEIGHLRAGWLLAGIALELASCASFVVLFRRFFRGIAPRQARRLAWTEMGSGALLPGGGVGSLAVGGWLLHLAGMPTRKIIRSSSGLFFLTSAVNLMALIAGALLLGAGLSRGHADLPLVVLPALAGLGALTAVLGIERVSRTRPHGIFGSPWVTQLIGGVGEAKRVAAHPSWRLGGAFGYLGFDIAVLWATLTAVGYSPPIAVLILGYIIGYLANLIPVPGAVGVLEGGIAGTLALYGAPLTEATAGVLVYHVIAFWIPSLGGLLAYRSLRLDLTPSSLAVPVPAPTRAAIHQANPPTPLTGGLMHTPAIPTAAHDDPIPIAAHAAGGPVSAVAPAQSAVPSPRRDGDQSRIGAVAPIRARRSRGAMRSRHVEAHAVAWLRSLRHETGVSS